jgi:hypothetical protein
LGGLTPLKWRTLKCFDVERLTKMSGPRLRVGDFGDEVARLQESLQERGLTLSPDEQKRKFFGPTTREAVGKFQAASGIDPTYDVCEATAHKLQLPGAIPDGILESPGTVSGGSTGPGTAPVAAAPLTIRVPHASVSSTPASAPTRSGGGTGVEGRPHSVEGRIYSDYGMPAAAVTVRVYAREFGGDAERLGETRTDANGLYALAYDTGGRAANIEIRALDPNGNEVPLSATKFNADKREVLNLVAPAGVQPLAPEYQRLSADVVRQLGDRNKLAEAREGIDGQDLTFLHQATGWDARLIALAANAVKASDDTGIPQSALYALFRAGLPSDRQQLAWVSSQAMEKALAKAREAGIISVEEIAGAKAAFERFARATRLAARAPGAASSFDDLLSKAGPNEAAKLTEAEKDAFADLYFAHRGSAPELWQAARDKDIPEAKIKGLRLQGKLAYLTLNNAALAESLQREIGSPENLTQLVDRDLYSASAWKDMLNNLANNSDDALKSIIPTAYAGETTTDRLEAYAADLARKVRLGFPTQVVVRMIVKGELPISDRPDDVRTTNALIFITNAAKLGFELGRTPFRPFLQQHQNQLFNGIQPASTLEDAKMQTVETVKIVQRLYQISPSDESLKVLLGQGFQSAYDVVAFPYDVFVNRFGYLFPSTEEARLVYRKAQQVSVVTYNLFTVAKQWNSTPAVFAVSPPPAMRENAKNELIAHFPTLESLFGSLDFCECEHCRSVLSPAAYFVDLLQFLDREDLVWRETLAKWKTTHNGASYPFTTPSEGSTFLADWKTKHANAPYPFKTPGEWTDFQNAWKSKHPAQPDPDPEMKLKPYDALIERRPDLPHLSLSCENTQTALPYIDLVNEILETYVAFDKPTDVAYDTGAATTPELLAEPQNVLPAAYDTLKSARYPLALPFDLWLETARGFLAYYEKPLWKVLETLRPGDDLSTPKQPYDRAAIFHEYLGISPAEYTIFSDPNPLAKWYELYGFQSEQEALIVTTDADSSQRIDLNSAKALSRRLGVSYRELIDLIRTSFVNPKLDVLAVLRELKLAADDVFRYQKHPKYPPLTAEEQAAFEQRLNDLTRKFNPSLDPAGFNAKNWLDTAWQSGELNHVLVLADPDSGCNFDQTTLQYANGNAATPLDFLRIHLFVRLWKKLGWTIEEVDGALRVLIPKNTAQILTAINLGEALKTALIYLAHLKALSERVQMGKNGLLKLLTLWSDLPTTGQNPLYRQLFLTRSVLKNDPVFDHPLGKYLCYFDSGSGQYKPFRWDITQPEDINTGNVPLKSHLLAVQGALKLTTEEIGRILADAAAAMDDLQQTPEQALASAPLNLPTVSLLYRYWLLAKALKLTLRDLIALKALSGLDPFKPLKPDPIAVLAEDYAWTQTLRFVEMAGEVNDSGFAVEDLEYLLRHRLDPVGKYRTSVEPPVGLVKSLATEIRRIRTEHAVPDDPAALSDDVLRQKLALLLPSDVAETFFAMWAGTKDYEAVYPNPVEAANKLNPETFAPEPAIRVSYDAVRQVQRLAFRGVPVDAKKAQLKTDFPSPIVAALLDDVQAQAKDFFKQHLEKATVGTQPVGFLDPADYDLLFAPLPNALTDAQKQDKLREKRQKLATAFLPFLQQRLIWQIVIQTLGANLTADPGIVDALLTNLLKDPSQPAKPLIEAFTAAGENGISAAFFASADGTGLPINAKTVSDASTQGKPADANNARFEGYLEVPTTGPYRFFEVFQKKDAEAELQFTHLPDPLLRGKAANDGAEVSQFTELKAGVPYRFTLNVRNPGTGDVALLVQGENLPKGSLASLRLYPQTVVERVRRGVVLLGKTVQLIQGLGLTEREVRYLLTHGTDFNNLELSKLPTQQDDSTSAATVLFGQFLRLVGYYRLRRDVGGGTDDFVDVFENARRALPASADADKAKEALLDDLYRRLADLTRRDATTIKAAAQRLGFAPQSAIVGADLRVEAPDFAQEKGIWRLWETLQVTETLGVPLDAIARWTEIVNPTKTSAERFGIARDLRNTVKARYEPENWQRIAQPIFDKLRKRQRDALVAYIMNRHGFDRVEQLFEFFLIDSGMEPIVQTSRIRLAISSVQLFIQRCLLNLEAKADPSVINSQHWQWMKRYRVWEANRKIFLFPENWLEPEFRDDKTHLFQELEGALLQGDVSNDLVEDAFFNYLKKLEKLARLEIVAMYCEEKPSDPASNTLHVIGRTFNEHNYYYRRYSHQMWTPWEPVTAEIEGDHIVAVMWRERLHLFWLTFLEKSVPNTAMAGRIQDNATAAQIAKAVIAAAPSKTVEVQLSWTEHFQGEWSARASSGFADPIQASVATTFNASDVFVYASKEYVDGEERAVKINLTGPIDGAFRLVSKNSPPKPDSRDYLLDSPYPSTTRRITRYTGSTPLKATFVARIETEDGGQPQLTPETKDILRKGGAFSVLTCNDRFSVQLGSLIDPFLIGPFPSYQVWQELLKWALITTQYRTLTTPFFYEDDQHTFFVEPTLTETTIEQWETWAVRTPLPDAKLDDDTWWKSIPLEPMVPAQPFPIDPIGPIARFTIQPKLDWIINPGTVLQFDERLIAKNGGIDPVLPVTAAAGGAAISLHGIPGVPIAAGDGEVGMPAATAPEGGPAIGELLTTPVGGEMIAGGLAVTGINVVGAGGLNPALRGNLEVGRGMTSGLAGGGVATPFLNR